MLIRRYPPNQKGFTLLEMMSVLVIMGVMVSVAIKKFDLLSDNASITALKGGVRELNTRETLVWTNIKLSETGYTDDTTVFNAVDKGLGHEYSWNPAPTEVAGTLHYKAQSVALVRTRSTRGSVGFWQ